MRYLILLIVILLLAWALWPEPEPIPVEETFIGDQVRTLRKAEKFQQEDYNKGLDEYRRKMDEQEEGDG